MQSIIKNISSLGFKRVEDNVYEHILFPIYYCPITSRIYNIDTNKLIETIGSFEQLKNLVNKMADKKSKAVVMIYLKDGKVLGVSRKDNPNSFGLIGGKVDDTDLSDTDAMKRECLEECGLVIRSMEKIGMRGNIAVFLTYVASGEIKTTESGVVKFIDWNELYKGAFIEENKDIFKILCSYIANMIYTFLNNNARLSIDEETYGKYNSPDANELYAYADMFSSFKIPKNLYSGSYTHGGFIDNGNGISLMFFTKLKNMINQIIKCFSI